MPTVTAPYIETQQVVTGFMYQLHIAEESNGQGIIRLEIGPYRFPGTPPLVKYPEAVTNEMCPPGWSSIRWVTDDSGQSWLRWEGGRLDSSDGEMLFQMTSNYPPTGSGAGLYVYRTGSTRADRFEIPTPDYSVSPPQINTRHDVIGKGTTFVKGGCVPPMIITLGTIIAIAVRHFMG